MPIAGLNVGLTLKNTELHVKRADVDYTIGYIYIQIKGCIAITWLNHPKHDDCLRKLVFYQSQSSCQALLEIYPINA